MYDTIVGDLKQQATSEISPFLESFCKIMSCSREDVSKNKDGLRTLLVACIVKHFDPQSVKGESRLRNNVLTQIAILLDVSHDNTKQISSNVKGLLRAHKPFIREVDRIIEGIKNDSKERE